MSPHQCSQLIWSYSPHPRRCSLNAHILDSDGQWYCGTHSPSTKSKRAIAAKEIELRRRDKARIAEGEARDLAEVLRKALGCGTGQVWPEYHASFKTVTGNIVITPEAIDAILSKIK